MIGHIVHYYDNADSRPLPAIVAKVWPDNPRLVNICLIREDGGTEGRQAVTLIEAGEEAPQARYCRAR